MNSNKVVNTNDDMTDSAVVDTTNTSGNKITASGTRRTESKRILQANTARENDTRVIASGSTVLRR